MHRARLQVLKQTSPASDCMTPDASKASPGKQMTPQEIRELRGKVWKAELRTQQLPDATSVPHAPEAANVARSPAPPTAPVLANLLKSQINMALAQQDSAEEAAAEELDDRIKIIILDVCLPACREISC